MGRREGRGVEDGEERGVKDGGRGGGENNYTNTI